MKTTLFIGLTLAVATTANGQCIQGDINGDGIVNGIDLSFVLTNWGQTCPAVIESVSPPLGPLAGGTAITITGSQLGGVLSVTIGGVTATNVVSVNPTTITAVTPPSKSQGPKDVVVTTNASSATLTGGFVYSPLAWALPLEFEPDPEVITDPEWRARIIATGLPWRVRDNASQIEMLLVPPGTFMMGCSPSLQYACEPDENPVHEVTLTQPFYLGRYEVTQAEWVAVMGTNPSYFQSPSPEVPVAHIAARPVEQISWSTIQFFTAETQLRLPSEAEWEYACRAGTTTAFNNGSNDDSTLDVLAWSSTNSSDQTRPTGMRVANALGFHDMHGNVAEWVEDWFGADYYSTSPVVDPLGPMSGVCRLLRGGHWSTISAGCRSSFRYCQTTDFANSRLGFRVARTP